MSVINSLDEDCENEQLAEMRINYNNNENYFNSKPKINIYKIPYFKILIVLFGVCLISICLYILFSVVENYYMSTIEPVDDKISNILEAIKNNVSIESPNNKKNELNNRILNSQKEEEKQIFINMTQEKFYLKDNLSYKITYILNNTEYKNTDINQYINYSLLLNPSKKKKINKHLRAPTKFPIKPFFTRKYVDKLNLTITKNKDPIFNPKKDKKDIFYLERYFVYLCRNKILLDKKKYRLSKKPKISIILPIYNRDKYIETILLSIQNQNIKDIEIIFVDDKSSDSSVKIIENFMKKDDRIVLLKNVKNSGTFYSRFVGIVFSKGEYIGFADTDDFFLPDILGNAYNIAVKKKLEIIQWQILMELLDGKVRVGDEHHNTSVVLTAKKLKYYMFYDNHENYAKLENSFIWDKLYKRDLLLRTMHVFPDDLITDHLYIHDDNLFLFTIFQNANNYFYISQYGYYWYLGESGSISNSFSDDKIANKCFLDMFKNLKFIFNYTPDDAKFKMMCFANFQFFMRRHKRQLKYITEGIQFMEEVLYLYLGCRFYNEQQRKKVIKIIKKLNIIDKSLQKPKTKKVNILELLYKIYKNLTSK